MRFAEIVRQLLDNACRYSPDGEAVSVRGRAMSEGVVVSVTDHGSGVHARDRRQGFREPFSAGEDILRKERAGAGVGLHMARQLVLQHGGIMWADPLPAGGTRFSFVIPARQGDTISTPPTLGEPEPLEGDLSIPSQLEAGATAPRAARRSSSCRSLDTAEPRPAARRCQRSPPARSMLRSGTCDVRKLLNVCVLALVAAGCGDAIAASPTVRGLGRADHRVPEPLP